MKLSRIALGSAVTLSLVGGSFLAASDAAAQCVTGYDDKGEAIVAPAAVMITGGTITNETVIDITANAGTSISDASGGNNNLATTGGGNDGGEGGTDIASSGNGGVANSSANGGAVSIQDINSGGNAGNAISVGDTVCAGAAPAPSAGGCKERGGNANAGGGGRGGQIRALPSTGIGMTETGTSGSLLLALGALGMMGLSVGSRLDRRVSATAGR